MRRYCYLKEEHLCCILFHKYLFYFDIHPTYILNNSGITFKIKEVCTSFKHVWQSKAKVRKGYLSRMKQTSVRKLFSSE